MPEYTLKIDIDERELERKLKRVFGTIGFPVGGGARRGGGSGGSGMAAFNALRPQLGQQKQIPMLEDKRKFTQFQKSLETAFGKFTGFGKGKGGGMLGMTPATAQFVKIAGIAAGLAGVGALGKMLIDSSPMLKAMLRLLSMGILLILRPIGDMIGFFLKPFIVMFVKGWAIPFFRWAKDWGPRAEEMAEGIIAFFSDPIGQLKIFGSYMWGLISAGLAPLLAGITGFDFGPVATWFDENIITPVVEFFETAGSWLDLSIVQPVLDFFEKAKEFLTIDMINSIVDFFVFVGAGVTGVLSVGWKLLLTWGARVWAGVKGVLTSSWQLLIDFWADNKDDINTTLITAWNAFVTFWGALRFGVIALTSVWENIKTFWNDIADALKKIWEKIEPIVALVGGVLGIRNTSTGGGGASPFDIQAAERAAAEISRNKGKGENPACGGTGVPRDSSAQHGGVITEPIFGVGKSGRTYSFGETGPETVSPGISSYNGGGGGNTFVFNIQGVGNAREFEYEVKPVILKILKEEKSRRGIL